MIKTSLPKPKPDDLEYSYQLIANIKHEIINAGGWISFYHYMEVVLYSPVLGYYSGGAKKFGNDGDFVTAPEISSMFAKALCNQFSQVLGITNGDILEIGAGSGQFAIDMLLELKANDIPIPIYYILEVSTYLRTIQEFNVKQKLPDYLSSRIIWLKEVPQNFNGLIFGNEVLDAIPVNIIQKQNGEFFEMGVIIKGDSLAWGQNRLTSGKLYELAKELNLPDDYVTEINLGAMGLIRSLSDCLNKGIILMVDYGFPEREFYHPQRNRGTLMCHYRHHAHDDPFANVGYQDITSHVNFSSIAEVASESNLRLLGYCNQSQFLINCGITELISQTSPNDLANYLPMVSRVQKLMSPSEMGELFKVIAFGKAFDTHLLGFVKGDKSHTL